MNEMMYTVEYYIHNTKYINNCFITLHLGSGLVLSGISLNTVTTNMLNGPGLVDFDPAYPLPATVLIGL